MRRFALIWIAAIFTTLVLGLIIFCAEEDWRGARDWAACQRELAAKGETLDLRQLAPPGKPEDDLSKVPMFAPYYDKNGPSDKGIRGIDPFLKGNYDDPDRPKYSAYKTGKPLDLTAWQKYYRSLPEAGLSTSSTSPSQDVLQVLNRYDDDLNQVNTAVSNPNAFFPVNYDRPFDNMLGSVTAMIRVAQVLSLRAIAHLGSNQADLALKDYLFSFRLNQPLLKKCFMVNYLVMVGVRMIDDAILWEGLHRHAWNDSQLRAMESALASRDLLEDGAQSLRLERGFGLQTAKVVRDSHYALLKDIVMGMTDEEKLGETENILFLRFRPVGWVDQESIFHVEYIQKRIDAIHPAEGTLDPKAFAGEKELKELGTNFYLSRIALGGLDHFGSAIARAETNRRLARLACRLEEYWLARGQYPDKLDELPELPAHLNQEVLSEDPLRYQRKGDGYLLYSVGWDQKDDGGVMSKSDLEGGDWAWPSP